MSEVSSADDRTPNEKFEDSVREKLLQHRESKDKVHAVMRAMDDPSTDARMTVYEDIEEAENVEYVTSLRRGLKLAWGHSSPLLRDWKKIKDLTRIAVKGQRAAHVFGALSGEEKPKDISGMLTEWLGQRDKE